MARSFLIVLSAGIEPASAPSEGAILSVERREQVKISMSSFPFWCPREESNLNYELRKLASYPLNDGGSSECISESEPCRHQIGECVRVFILVNMVKKVSVHSIRINVCKRNHQVRREPAFCFYGEYRRKLSFNVLKD